MASPCGPSSMVSTGVPMTPVDASTRAYDQALTTERDDSSQSSTCACRRGSAALLANMLARASKYEYNHYGVGVRIVERCTSRTRVTQLPSAEVLPRLPTHGAG